ncbi:MAG: TIGR03619 family F420-dependent LLM class oxidoreductase [Gammaproteobacteria bacterium]|nr:TIGR03619 family F420-dependent LLM class oxidoreductase [Gammaproteobacteria bacterium]
MEIGVTIRNMGPQSSTRTLTECAKAAESLNFESLWITDHIAIPPDDAQGSEGRYLDPLTTLAYLGGITSTIKLGTGVIILPYRAPLPMAKQVATVQELTGERLLLGVGIGWMHAEFKALGIQRRERGAVSDATLEFLNRCFADEVVQANGQEFLFRPQPTKPPVYVGGAAPHALRRAARLADGWLPMGLEPSALATAIATYREIAQELDRPEGRVTLMRGLPLADPGRCQDLIGQYAELGIERLVAALRYDTSAQHIDQLESLSRIRPGQ